VDMRGRGGGGGRFTPPPPPPLQPFQRPGVPSKPPWGGQVRGFFPRALFFPTLPHPTDRKHNKQNQPKSGEEGKD